VSIFFTLSFLLTIDCVSSHIEEHLKSSFLKHQYLLVKDFLSLTVAQILIHSRCFILQ